MTQPTHVSRSPFLLQLEFPLVKERTPDRNLHKGGRSFYFFDFDDNVMHLDTTISVFENKTGEEKMLTTREFAIASGALGKPGEWEQFGIRPDDATGSFRRFRDLPEESLAGRQQPFLEDVAHALAKHEVEWRGPSWEVFSHAVFNERPIAIVTARGHEPEVMRAGIAQLCRAGHLPGEPNYLAIFPVSNPTIAHDLSNGRGRRSVPELKRAAIVRAVEIAMEKYGNNPFHRFGVSDDDSSNLALILDAMAELKQRYPQNSFFVIDTGAHPVEKTEVLVAGQSADDESPMEQLPLFRS